MKNFLIFLLATSCLAAFGQETGCTFELADNYDVGAVVDDGSCTFGGGVYIDPIVVSTALFDPCGGDGILRDESITSTNWNYEAYRQALADHIENVGYGRVFVVEMHQEVMFPDFDGYGFDYENFPDPAWEVSCAYGASNGEWIPSITIAFSNPCFFAACLGCADPTALNFETSASIDDGSCIYSSDACGEGTIWDEVSQTCIIDETFCSWQPDSDGDLLIGVSDLLMFLSVFGDTDLDQDGIFDSNDDCVGAYDECGVCNGSGPSIPIIESIEILYDSLYAEQIDEWWVFEVGVDTTFTLVCEVIEGCTDSSAVNFMMEANVDDGSCWLGCGSPINYWEHYYETVFADGKCWFAEDLQTTRYADGSEIPSAQGSEWLNTSEGLHYNNMYNGYAVNDDRGLCPTGWHVSTVSEWHSILSDYGPYSQQNSCCGYYYGIAQHFKHSSWDGGLNTSGLSVKPNGYMNPNGTFVGGSQATFGTPTYHAPNFHGNGNNQVSMGQTQVLAGQAIRCIKD